MPKNIKPNKDDAERDRWIVANMAGVLNFARPESVAALKRRDERERKRGMAMAALIELDEYGENCHDSCYRRIAREAGPAAMRWARNRKGGGK